MTMVAETRREETADERRKRDEMAGSIVGERRAVEISSAGRTAWIAGDASAALVAAAGLEALGMSARYTAELDANRSLMRAAARIVYPRQAMRSNLVGLLLVVGCGPSAGTDEACTHEDVVSSGALVVGFDRVECSPCDLETSYVLITLETACEAGVEWGGEGYRLIDYTTAVNLATGERFMFEDQLGQPADGSFHVSPDEPYIRTGPSVDLIVTEPGDYSFRVELEYDLMAAEFEGSVE